MAFAASCRLGLLKHYFLTSDPSTSPIPHRPAQTAPIPLLLDWMSPQTNMLQPTEPYKSKEEKRYQPNILPYHVSALFSTRSLAVSTPGFHPPSLIMLPSPCMVQLALLSLKDGVVASMRQRRLMGKEGRWFPKLCFHHVWACSSPSTSNMATTTLTQPGPINQEFPSTPNHQKCKLGAASGFPLMRSPKRDYHLLPLVTLAVSLMGHL